MYTNSKLSKSIRLALAFGAASSLAFAGGVNAQEENDEEEEARSERPERIQVVGSRIRTDGLDSATPIDIISTEIASEQGLNTLGELLRTSTIASGSDQLISAYSVGFVTSGGAGAESISMRGLGANRTLVLLNGRRAGPAGTRGQVSAFDMNSLPVSAVERVEILKDGASSLYGSDAVAGVINIITKRGDDKSINVSASQPFESGGETFRVNGTYGTAFDRGSYRIVADYNLNTGLKRGDRDHFGCPTRYLFDIETGERGDPIDPRTGDFHCNDNGFGLWVNNGGRFQFDRDGFGFPNAASGDEYGNPLLAQAPDGWYWAGHNFETDGWYDNSSDLHKNRTMIPKSEVWSIYQQADYDLTNNVSAYAELMHSQRTTEIDSVRQFWTSNPGLASFIPVDTLPGWEAINPALGVMPVALTDHFSSETTVDYSRFVLGLEGALGYWNWDVSWQRSLNRGEYKQDIIYRDSMVMAHEALLGLRDCGPGEVTEFSQKQCVQLNWFTDGHLTGTNYGDAQADFIFGNDKGKTVYKQDTVDAYITGDVLDLPAGPLATAVGVAYQTDELQDTPGFHTRNGNSWGLSSAGITAGRSTTTAAYAEIQAPLVRDVYLMEALDLTASARYTNVNTYGSGETYKLSANWTIGNGFRMRASRGTSFRAPALFELFLEGQTGFLGQLSDPCVNWVESTNEILQANCQAAGVPDTYIAAVGGSMTSITGGGAGQLEAETSTSEGIGLVYTSPESTFAVSADYYDVTIRGQISNVAGGTVLANCYFSEAGFDNEPFCRQITRRTGNEGNNFDWGVETVRGGYLNTSEQRVRGADFVVTYQTETPVGHVRMRLNHTSTIERYFKQFSDSDPIQFVGRVGNPKQSGNLNTTLTRDDWSFNWNIQYVDRVSNNHLYTRGDIVTYRGEDYRVVGSTGRYFMHSASVNTTVGDNLDVTFGIANLFDRLPPQASPSRVNTAGNTMLFASQYELLGRRAFLNMSYSF
ncbi:outer membrane receptor for ferrienterochelin and colicin [Idiomarina sp. A28L]|uniref:TonB-dependent receptor plug domain-containing protein n=1 Tax=Idiomarina sp. A28L TaxID=1036674 RepID=UPI0002138924|nr:TonB-dependent receptor [Idiomarina sp. A28L]EGN74949.1 outer membrane receptor for ferrienterochelin and colicin [Idiomarina sp. A28L]